VGGAGAALMATGVGLLATVGIPAGVPVAAIGAVLGALGIWGGKRPELVVPAIADQRFVISDRLGRFATEGRSRAILLRSQRTAQEEEASLVQYQTWMRSVGIFLFETLGGAAHNRFNAGRDGDQPEAGGIVDLYNARVQRLQYILDHPEEFPINPDWDGTTPSEEFVGLLEPNWHPVDKRQGLRTKLQLALEKGQKITNLGPEMGFADDSQSWFKETFNLIDKEIGSVEATQFQYAWNPTPGGRDIGLRHSHFVRLNHLEQLISRVNTLPIGMDQP
jgi:hypothetical protein